MSRNKFGSPQKMALVVCGALFGGPWGVQLQYSRKPSLSSDGQKPFPLPGVQGRIDHFWPWIIRGILCS